MSGIKITRTFDSIYDEFKLNEDDQDQRLRAKKNKLYVHEGLTDPSGRKEQKRKDGAQHVWNAIEAQYGPEVRNEVFRKVSDKLGRDRDPSQELFRKDLDLIDTTIKDELWDRSVKEKSNISDKPVVELPPPRDTEPLSFRDDLNDVQVRQKEIFSPQSGDLGYVKNLKGGKRMLENMLGFKLTKEQVRGLGGIPDPYHVEIKPCRKRPGGPFPDEDGTGAVTIRIFDEKQAKKLCFREIDVTVYRDTRGRVKVYRESSNTNFDLEPPSGIGGCGLLRQVHMARSLGIDVVCNESSRSSSMNGYYTWARYGGNAPLVPRDMELHWEGEQYRHFMEALNDPGTAFDEVLEYEQDKENNVKFNLTKEEFVNTIDALNKEKLSVQELMATDAGRAFWRVFGFTIPLTFDLTDDSLSMSILREYGGKQCGFDLSDL